LIISSGLPVSRGTGARCAGTLRLARRAAPVARRRSGPRVTRRGRGTSVLCVVNHRSPGLQGRPGATRNAPCSIVIHHYLPITSHQAWTAPIVGTSQLVVAGWRQRPRVRRRHISRGSRDQTATHPRSGPALLSAVAHRTARVPEPMATSSRRRAERTSSPRCAVGAGRNYFDPGPMLSVCPAIFSSIQQRPFVLRGQKTKPLLRHRGELLRS